MELPTLLTDALDQAKAAVTKEKERLVQDLGAFIDKVYTQRTDHCRFETTERRDPE